MGIGRFFYTKLLPLMERQLHFVADLAGLTAITCATGLTVLVPVWLVLSGLSGAASAFVFLFAAAFVAKALATAGNFTQMGWRASRFPD
jgi:hypothetical protein